MSSTCVLAILLCATSLALAQSKKSDWTIKGHIPPDQFVIQSHRGAGELAEENTPEAFELGWSLGTVPESDVRTTKDGVIVAFHDNNFARVVKDASGGPEKEGHQGPDV
jgi:glycerophosphoryl diester phosphodiesterase